MESQIRNNIISIRNNLKYSQEYMAHRLNTNQSNYSKIERGDIKMTLELLIKISVIFKLRIIDIITYPIEYINPIESNIAPAVEKIKTTLQVELSQEKKDQILKLVFGENVLDILNK